MTDTKSQIIAQGAEAIITIDKDKITKNRIKKSYRIPFLDEKLRKSRTRSEAKIISKLENIIPVPKILKTDEKQTIEMQFINGKKLSDSLESLDYKKISKIIADNISKMHNQGITHGDLTTSNMIYVDDNSPKNSVTTTNNNIDIDNINTKSAKQLSKRREFSICNMDMNSKIESSSRLLSKNIQSSESEIANSEEKVYFIDFGLAFHSNKIEDKAVDLHLLQQALEAKHFTIWQDCWKIILNKYNANQSKDILQRIKVIESRGRYKDKY